MLYFSNRAVSFKDVVWVAVDAKCLPMFYAFFYFIQILTVTNVLQEIVTAFSKITIARASNYCLHQLYHRCTHRAFTRSCCLSLCPL